MESVPSLYLTQATAISSVSPVINFRRLTRLTIRRSHELSWTGLCSKCAGIAQLVEQLICNQQVVGSNPTAGSLDFQTFECRFAIARKRSGHTRLNARAFEWPRLDAFNSEVSSLLLQTGAPVDQPADQNEPERPADDL